LFDSLLSKVQITKLWWIFAQMECSEKLQPRPLLNGPAVASYVLGSSYWENSSCARSRKCRLWAKQRMQALMAFSGK